MSYEFDGIDDVLSNNTNGGADLNIGTYSTLAWVKTGSHVGTSGHVMGRATGNHVSNNHLVLRTTNAADADQDINRQQGVGGYNQGGTTNQNGVLQHSTGMTAWDVFVTTFEQTRTPRFDTYLNGGGTFVYAGTDTPVFGEAANFGIGMTEDGNRPFDGRIGHVAIWNRVLTAQEITDLTNGGVPSAVAASGLLRYWPLTADAAVQVDEQGSGHDLTVTGAVYSTDEPPVTTTVKPVVTSPGKTATTIDLAWTIDGVWDSYEIRRGGVIINTVTGLSYTDTGLTPGAEYTYEVRAARAV